MRIWIRDHSHRIQSGVIHLHKKTTLSEGGPEISFSNARGHDYREATRVLKGVSSYSCYDYRSYSYRSVDPLGSAAVPALDELIISSHWICKEIAMRKCG